MVGVHQGSWLGLPDFGVTERVSNFFGQGRTSSGGSNLFGNQAQTTLVPAGTTPSGSPKFAPSGQSGAYGISSGYPSTSYSPQGGGQVLGASTVNTGGSGGGSPAAFAAPTASPQDGGGQPQGPDFAAQQKAVYDAYLGELDRQIAGLGDQRLSQEQVANNTYNQGLNTANSQYATSQAELDANRQKTLRDLSQNLQSSWQRGNQYLGTRGASDSSAANQYAFALSKLGSQQRGDVQGQYDQNLFKLKNVYDTETKNLELEKNNQLQQISQWFSDAQNSLRGQKSEIAAQQSQQALSIAMQMADRVNQELASKRAALDTWAANHATSFNQLQQQLASTGSYNVSAPNGFSFTGQSSFGPAGAATGYGNTQEKYDMFGNRIQ